MSSLRTTTCFCCCCCIDGREQFGLEFTVKKMVGFIAAGTGLYQEMGVLRMDRVKPLSTSASATLSTRRVPSSTSYETPAASAASSCSVADPSALGRISSPTARPSPSLASDTASSIFVSVRDLFTNEQQSGTIATFCRCQQQSISLKSGETQLGRYWSAVAQIVFGSNKLSELLIAGRAFANKQPASNQISNSNSSSSLSKRGSDSNLSTSRRHVPA